MTILFLRFYKKQKKIYGRSPRIVEEFHEDLAATLYVSNGKGGEFFLSDYWRALNFKIIPYWMTSGHMDKASWNCLKFNVWYYAGIARLFISYFRSYFYCKGP